MKFVVDGIGGAPGSSVGVILERLIGDGLPLAPTTSTCSSMTGP